MYRYELRSIDAWNDGEGWTWNDSYHIADITIGEGDEKRALAYACRKQGIVCNRGRCKWQSVDGSLFELVNRKTNEPLIAAVPMF